MSSTSDRENATDSSRQSRYSSTTNALHFKVESAGDKANSENVMFDIHSSGIDSSRDAWAYDFGRNALILNIRRMIDYYNEQLRLYSEKYGKKSKGERPAAEDFIRIDPRKMSWSGGLKGDLEKLKAHNFELSSVRIGSYRPFCKQVVYFNRDFNNRVYRLSPLFPNEKLSTPLICMSGIGASKDFSALIIDTVPNRHFHDTGQCFPLYYYEEAQRGGLFDNTNSEELVRRDAISETALAEFRKTYEDKTIGKEDLFYYVYGILHSQEYKTRFEADLKKQLPRMPYVRDFWAFSKAGRELAHWHLNYEIIEPWPLAQIGELDLGDGALYRVQKMAWAKQRIDGKLVEDKTTLIYNSRITLTGNPPEALTYVVNGKPAIEWIIERYQVTTDKDSGIVNDPNDWATEHDDPAYILNLVKRIVRVSVETMKIVNALPALEERK